MSLDFTYLMVILLCKEQGNLDINFLLKKYLRNVDN